MNDEPRPPTRTPGTTPPDHRPGAADGYQLPDLVLIVRDDGTIRFANRPVGGVPADEAIGTSLFAYVPPEQHETVRACLEAVFGQKQTEGCDLAGLRPGESDAWYQCRFAPNTRSGKVATATVIARDITGRKQLEDALRRERDELHRRVEELVIELAAARVERKTAVRRSERMDGAFAQFGALVDEAGEAMFVTDLGSGRLVDLNETACRWLQRPREELMDRTPEELDLEFPLRIPDETAPAFTDTRDTRRPIMFDNVRHRRRDQTSFPVEVSLTRHQLGERDYILAVVRDVNRREQAHHALQETERVYRALVECAGDAVFLTARDGEIEDANRAALELFGYDRGQFLRTNARELYADPRDVVRFRDAIREHGAVADLDVRLRTRGGGDVRGRLWAVPRQTRDGGIRGYQCVVRRVLERAVDAPAAARPAMPDTVVVVDGDAERRRAAAAALGQAGMGVVEAGSLEEMLSLLEDQAWHIRLVLVDEGALTANTADGERLRALVRGAPVIVLTERTSDADRPDAALLGGRPVRRPHHPLALLQVVRETLATDH